MLDAYGLSPLHRLGQNFLHDHNILGKLVDASGVQAGDLVVEIGPGTGALTEALLERGEENFSIFIYRPPRNEYLLFDAQPPRDTP